MEDFRYQAARFTVRMWLRWYRANEDRNSVGNRKGTPTTRARTADGLRAGPRGTAAQETVSPGETARLTGCMSLWNERALPYSRQSQKTLPGRRKVKMQKANSTRENRPDRREGNGTRRALTVNDKNEKPNHQT